MPINYQISILSDLFGGIPSKTAEWISAAKVSFIQGTNTYCNGKCKLPTPDKPFPIKIPTTYNAVSSLYGGNGGDDFNYNFNTGESSQQFGGDGGASYMIYVPPGYKWTGIIGKGAKYIDKLGFIFTKTVYTYNHRHLTKIT